MIVSQTALAEIIGVSLRTLTTWQAEGLPVAQRGQRGTAHQYSTPDVIAWLAARAIGKATATTAKDRLLELQATETELRLQERRASLVEASAVAPAWAAMVASAREYLRAEPDRLVALLRSVDTDAARRTLLADQFDAALRRLSQLSED